MKTLVLAAALATALTLPAFAEDAAAPADTAAKPEHHRDGPPRGELRAELKKEKEGERDARRAEHEAERKAFEEKLKAAKTPEEREALIKAHRAEMDAARKKHFDEETAEIAKRRAEMDAKRAEMKAKHAEHHKAPDDAVPAKAE